MADETKNPEIQVDAELQLFLSSKGISVDAYKSMGEDARRWLTQDMEKENAEFKSYLEANATTVEEYMGYGDGDKNVVNQEYVETNKELVDLLKQNNLTPEQYVASDLDTKLFMNDELRKSKGHEDNLTPEQRKERDDYEKSIIEMEKKFGPITREQIEEIKNKLKEGPYTPQTDEEKRLYGAYGAAMHRDNFEKLYGKNRKNEREDANEGLKIITPRDGEEITPADVGNEVQPEDIGTPGEQKEDAEKPKFTDGFKKSGLRHADDQDGPKGPFKEDDIINYMYNEWLIAAANWCYEKVGKKLKEWGTAAYIAYLDGRAEGRQKREELKKQGKTTKTIDGYLSSQDKLNAIRTNTTTYFAESVLSINKTFELIKEGKFDQINLSGLGKEKEQALLKAFSSMKNGKITEQDLAKMPEEKRKDIEEKMKNGATPLTLFCEETQQKLENMSENYALVSQIAFNYAAAKVGDTMARNKETDPKEIHQAEVKLMRETMATIFANLETIEKDPDPSKDPYAYLEQLSKASQKAKNTTDRQINNGIVMEYGARPLNNSGLGDMEQLLTKPTLEDANEANLKLTLYETLYKGNVTDEGNAQIVEALTMQMANNNVKKNINTERKDKLFKNIHGKGNNGSTEETDRGSSVPKILKDRQSQH
ncbi:MAG: hypothetical protein LBR70_03210 [Lactobacillaceae bacterium]|jgi:hypothetical protein|nr:hypothetical protein [Lactobacillaceae bacterium]